ncbi:hypothetical protein ROLI_001650 [Roseobacter fucihabitans]|uniref:DUF1631 family protein n=1 Tax=Roseobacter fucihabitans TaxID=1537242 RepID=A0ABZ2BNQ8_9RHOB|nr:contractile injection system tape measure protein [Roseobacter litoralis]MBC6963415.1 hypothetical protein [Roseobacter litoralis]
MTRATAQMTKVPAQAHAITRMTIDFDVVSQNGDLATPEAVLMRSREHLLPVLEQVLNDASVAGGVARIDLLEIDLGDWPDAPDWRDLRRVFAEKLTSALHPFLTWPKSAQVSAGDETPHAHFASPPAGQEAETTASLAKRRASEEQDGGSRPGFFEALSAFLSRIERLRYREVDPVRRGGMARLLRAMDVSRHADGSKNNAGSLLQERIEALDATAQEILDALIQLPQVPFDAPPSHWRAHREAAPVVAPEATPNLYGHERVENRAVTARGHPADPTTSEAVETTVPQNASDHTLDYPSDRPAEQRREIAVAEGSPVPVAAQNVGATLVDHLETATLRSVEIETALALLLEKNGLSLRAARDRAQAIAPHIAIRTGATQRRARPPAPSRLSNPDEIADRSNKPLPPVEIARAQGSGKSPEDLLKQGPAARSEALQGWLELLRAAGHAPRDARGLLDFIYGEDVALRSAQEVRTDASFGAAVPVPDEASKPAAVQDRADHLAKRPTAPLPNKPPAQAPVTGTRPDAGASPIPAARHTDAVTPRGDRRPESQAERISRGVGDIADTGGPSDVISVASTVLMLAELVDTQSGRHWRAMLDVIWSALPDRLGQAFDKEYINTFGMTHDVSGKPGTATLEGRQNRSDTGNEPHRITRPLGHQPGAASAPDGQASKSKEPPPGGNTGEPREQPIDDADERAAPDRSTNAGGAGGDLDAAPHPDQALSAPHQTRTPSDPTQPGASDDTITPALQNHDRDYLRAVMALVTAQRGSSEQFTSFLEDEMRQLFPDMQQRRSALRQIAARLSYSDGATAPGLRHQALAAVEALLSEPVKAAENSTRQEGGEASAIAPQGDEAYLSQRGGLVLFFPFVTLLFERLDLLDKNRQLPKQNIPAAQRALQLLADSAAPQDQPPDPVEKLLLGLAQNWTPAPVPAQNTADVELIDSLLVSVIERWGALGQTSPDGLRDAFIRRDAILRRQENGWLLHVESGPFDMLLDRLPWSFGTVALPWMPEPCTVHWRNTDA